MGEAPPAKEHVLCVLPFPEDRAVLDRIERKHPNVEFTYRQVRFKNHSLAGINAEDIPDELYKKATILVIIGPLPRPSIVKNLKLIHLFSAGVDWATKSPLWKETSIPFTNSSGVHAPQIAEWSILQILSNSHKEKLLLEWQRQHTWGSSQGLGAIRDSVGQRIGILGYGAIGRQTARLGQALGLDIIAYTASPRTTPESKYSTGYTVPGTGDPTGAFPSAWYSGLSKPELHNFLSQSIDILLISVPLTPETHHFLGAEEFEILAKNKAFIINIARGPIVQHDDLIAALKKGQLRGAALDVTEPEPLPKDSELWDLDNVAITPHVSGQGTAYFDRSFAILEENLTRIEKGKNLINLVDKRRGY